MSRNPDAYERDVQGYVLASMRAAGLGDDGDRAQALQLAEIEAANATRPVRAGRERCRECGRAISAQRQALGAELCFEHQHEAEAKAAHFKQWRR